MGKKIEPHQHDHTALRISVLLSTLCLIHCIVFPILIIALPMFNLIFEVSHWVEWTLLAGTFTIGLYSLWHGYSLHHKKLMPMIIFFIGMFISVAIHLIFKVHTSLPFSLIAIVGAIFIAYSQFYNLKLTRNNACTTKH